MPIPPLATVDLTKHLVCGVPEQSIAKATIPGDGGQQRTGKQSPLLPWALSLMGAWVGAQERCSTTQGNAAWGEGRGWALPGQASCQRSTPAASPSAA